MKSLAFAVLVVAACTPDVDHYPVVPSSSPTTIGQTNHPPDEPRPDAGVDTDDGGVGDGGIGDGGIGLGDGGVGFDALPTAFDAGAPTDVGSPAADAGVPPSP
jgi:hypothetical protein